MLFKYRARLHQHIRFLYGRMQARTLLLRFWLNQHTRIAIAPRLESSASPRLTSEVVDCVFGSVNTGCGGLSDAQARFIEVLGVKIPR